MSYGSSCREQGSCQEAGEMSVQWVGGLEGWAQTGTSAPGGPGAPVQVLLEGGVPSG